MMRCPCAEALFLVDDDQAELLEAHVAREQAVGAHHHVDLACFDVAHDPLLIRA